MRLRHLPIAAAALLASNAAFAQDFGGTSFVDAVCAFTQSPFVAGIFAVLIIAFILAWLNDLVKGATLEILKYVIGAMVIVQINTILSWIGMPSIC